MTINPPFRVIGLMSGSSLDGLDIACCDFVEQDGAWSFSIIVADCVMYDTMLQNRLRTAPTLNGFDLAQLHADFGQFCGTTVADFIAQHALTDVTCIASHGHTVFHAPHLGFTTQIGCGAHMAAIAKQPVICDFRSGDIARGGQGAPLVPMGDRALFGDYAALLNLGGIANITLQHDAGSVAGDLCAANQLFNHYAGLCGHAYDYDGHLSATGTTHAGLLTALNALPFCALPFPKSLDNGFARDVVIPLIDKFTLQPHDVLRTLCDHIAMQVVQVTQGLDGKLLVTGGGAFHQTLINTIAAQTTLSVVVPAPQIVQYKEALIFAFLGALRWQQRENILASATGAKCNSIGGAVYWG